jgi:hypothetical protein
MTVRLHLDGSQILWALVRCEICTDVNKYLAVEAAHLPIRCKKCGYAMDVRARLMADAATHTEIAGDVLSKLGAPGQPRP